MRYKALIVDIDGTLVPDFHSLPSEKVTKAIKKASEKMHVGLATSRPLIYAKPIMEHLSLSGPSIVTNGAEIIDAKSHKELKKIPIALSDTAKLTQIIEESGVKPLINDAGKDIAYTTGYVWKQPLDIWFPKLTKEQADSISKALHTIPTLFHWVGKSRFEGYDIVVTHAGATKQHGILEVAQILGIATHEIIGVGDGPNDFPLLMACGLKVAMGNAQDDLKAIADYVAPSVHEDGVADVIERFILSV